MCSRRALGVLIIGATLEHDGIAGGWPARFHDLVEAARCCRWQFESAPDELISNSAEISNAKCSRSPSTICDGPVFNYGGGSPYGNFMKPALIHMLPLDHLIVFVALPRRQTSSDGCS